MKGIFFLIFIPFLALSQSNDVLKIRGTKPIELLNSDELFYPCLLYTSDAADE